MKRLLSILAALGLTAVTASSVVACGDEIQTWAMPKDNMKTTPVVTDTEWNSTNCTVTLELSAALEDNVTANDVSLVFYKTKAKVEGLKIKDTDFRRADSLFILDISKENRSFLKNGEKYQLLVKGIKPGTDIDSTNYFTYTIPDVDKPDNSKTA